MKAMALNQAQNTQTSMTMSQMVSKLNKAVEAYGKNEGLATIIAVMCAIVVMAGVVMMSTGLMVAGAVVLVAAVTPMVNRWCGDGEV